MARNPDTPSYQVTDIQVLEGLEAVRRRPGMYIGSTDPQFESQTKAKLGNPELRGQVESVIGEALSIFLDKNTSEAK